jgi:hypothetical protein
MAMKKPTPKKTTRVSPSARGEGSKRKPVAKRVSPSARGEGSTNTKATVAMKKNTAKVQESGVSNLPATIVKAAKTIYDYVGKSGKAAPKTNAAPSSNVKIIPSKTKVQKRVPRSKTVEEAARRIELSKKRAELLNKKK